MEVRAKVNLVDIEALHSLTTIGGYLGIYFHQKLTSVQGLRSLANIGGYLWMSGNSNLVSVEGLQNLKFIRGTFGGNAIMLHVNPALARGLPFPALTCKAGPVYPGDSPMPMSWTILLF